MNTQLKYQIQEHRPQCRCEDDFGTDNNPHNERCSICDEGLSGVADKIAKATKLCVEKTIKAFSDNWDLELNDLFKIMSQEHLEMISYLAVPYDLLDWFEEYNGEMFGYIFEDMAMNLRLQKVSDQVEMLIEIRKRANNILWEQRQIEKIQKEEEPKKKRIIRKKVCNGLRCREHSYEPMDCWYDCPQCCERGYPPN